MASSFSKQAHKKQEMFKLKIKRELAELEQMRHSLDIERGEAQMKFSMMDDRNAKKAATVCQHCHKTI
ncbi:MAG: cytochrome c553 [Paraglaciecola sp.]